jgi:6-phosphogluconolactonase
MAKRISIVSLVLSLIAQAAVAGESPFLIYAPSRSTNSLIIIEAQPNDGSLSLKQSQKIDLTFPAGTIVAHPKKPLLYVAAPRPDLDGDKASGAVITIDGDGSYSKHDLVTFEHGYSYLSLDRSNRFLLGAYYFGGQVDVYSLDADGRPGKRVAALDEGRKNAHCVLPSPDNHFVYIPYVKETNGLFQYRFDARSGSLMALEPRNAQPPEGTGPRHMAYHPTLPVAYFSNEQHLGVSVYERLESGQLKLQQVCDAVPDNEPKDGVSSSDILVTSDGRFVFAGIRGHQRDFDWISRYRVKKNGELELLGLTPADKIPWGLTLSPDGGYLLVTAFEGATLTAFEIQQNGGLSKAASIPWDEQITDLVAQTR